MSCEQMDAHLEQMVNARSEARMEKELKRSSLLKQRYDAECAAERKRMRRRRKIAYRSAFHGCAFFCAVFAIWGVSELSGGNPIAGVMLSILSISCGLLGSIFDRMGGD